MDHFIEKITKNRVKVVLITLSVIFTVMFVCTTLYRKKKSMYIRRNEIDELCYEIAPTETIFVSIASFRDSECAPTLYNLFEKADCPFRVFAGVCQQNNKSDKDVMSQYEHLSQNGIKSFVDNIRVYSMPADEAKGPMLARAIIEQKLY
jgi:hypothetical protein